MERGGPRVKRTRVPVYHATGYPSGKTSTKSHPQSRRNHSTKFQLTGFVILTIFVINILNSRSSVHQVISQNTHHKVTGIHSSFLFDISFFFVHFGKFFKNNLKFFFAWFLSLVLRLAKIHALLGLQISSERRKCLRTTLNNMICSISTGTLNLQFTVGIWRTD